MIIATVMIMTIIIIIIIIAPVMILTIIMVTMELRSASAFSPSRTKIKVIIKYQTHDHHSHYDHHCPSHAHHHTSFTTIMIIIHRNHDRLQQSPFQDAHHLEVDFQVNSCASNLLLVYILLISVKILYFNHHHDHNCHDQ